MKLEEIKAAVRDGKTVCWASDLYEVILHTFPSKEEQWLIKCVANDSCIGLTWMDEVTMNGEEKDFYIKGTKV